MWIEYSARDFDERSVRKVAVADQLIEGRFVVDDLLPAVNLLSHQPKVVIALTVVEWVGGDFYGAEAGVKMSRLVVICQLGTLVVWRGMNYF